jgi:hypothetical protein
MPNTLGPNGEVFDENGNLIMPATRGSGQLPPEAPGGDLQANTSQSGAPSFKATPESDTGSTPYGSGQKQQTQQPSDVSKTIADLIARRRMQGAQQGSVTTGGGAGAVYDAQGNLVTSSPGLTAQAAAGAGSTMDASGAIRDPSGNIYDSNANLAAQDVGGAGATMPGGGGASGATTAGAGGMGGAIGGAIGSIGSALQSALSNVPSWKMQASAIPDPSTFKQNQP